MTEPATFVLHRRSSLDPRHVESPHEEVVEVVCRWGSEVLSVRHLRDGERFVLSAEPDDRRADLHVKRCDIGGDSKVWVCIQQRAGRWCVRLPPSLCSDAEECLLERDQLVVFWVGAVEVRVRRVRAGRGAARSGRSDRAMVGAFVAACLGCVSVIGVAKERHESDAALRFEPVGQSAEENESYIRALIARTQRAVSAPGEGAAGARGVHDQSPAGAPSVEAQRGSATRGGHRVGLSPRRHGEPAPVSVADPGVFAALGRRAIGAQVNPFMGVSELGAAALGAAGSAAIGDSVADAFGYGGLGGGVQSVGALSGSMYGVCGCMEGPTVRGLALFAIAPAVSERARTAAEAPIGERTTSGPRVCGGRASCTPTVLGTYPRETIRRVVRRNIGQFEHCYEQAMARNSASEGRVAVRFVINGDGSVLGSRVESDTSGDALLASCVAQAFRRLQFDPPEDQSIVTVTYPMTFTSN